MTAPFHDEEELTPDEIARQHRRALIRRVIVIIVVIAMIATLLVPVIVRVVRAPSEPDGILATQASFASRRMTV